MRTKSSLAGLLIGLSLTSACVAGPRYTTPSVTVPAAYKETVPAGADVLQPAQPRDTVSRAGWWEMFGDARLNDLETQLAAANPAIAGAEARVREARAVVKQDRAAYFPLVTAGASAARTHAAQGSRQSATTATVPTGTINEFAINAGASWEPDLWGRIRQTVNASTASAQASVGDLESVRLALSGELAADYFQLRATDAELALFAQTIDADQRAATLTRNQYNAGIVSRLDVEQADTQLESAQAQAADLGLQRAQLEHAVAVLLGQPPASVSLPPMPLDGQPPAVQPELPSRILERRPDVAAAERRVAAANAQIGVASAAFFPSLMLNLTGGFQATRLQEWLSWPTRFWSVGPAVAQTVFDGGQRKAVKAQAVAGFDEAAATYRQTVLTAFQDVEDNLAAVRILADEAERQHAAVASAQRSLDISLNQYRAGTVSYLQVATGQTALLANQRAALSVTERQFDAAVQLVRALGGSWNGSLSGN